MKPQIYTDKLRYKSRMDGINKLNDSALKVQRFENGLKVQS